MRLSVLYATLLAGLCAFFAAPASAAGRGDVYSVSGVRADVTASDATQARNLGFRQAQRLAFERVVRRLTLPDELARQGGVPALQDPQLDRLVAGVDIEEERRSGTRYIARLAVNFDPSGIRKALRDRGLSVVDTRTAPILVVPLLQGGSPELTTLWRQAWAQGGFAEDLVPVAVAPADLTGAPDWGRAQAAAGAAGATSALYAAARVTGASVIVELTEVGASQAVRPRGQLSASANPGEQGLAAAFQRLADAANARVQTEWKSRLATGGGQRARVSASALYEGQAQWARLKRGLEGAASTLISEIRIEAVSKNGATLSFSYTGSPEQLQAELRRYGVLVERAGQGLILRPAPV